MNSDWIDHKEAAALMYCRPSYLRERHKDGTYKYFPDIERWQPRGKRTQVFVRREHVEAWIERSRTPAPVKREFKGTGYESALPTLLRLGAHGTIASLGLKDSR